MWWIAYLWWLIPHIHLILSVFIRDQGQFSSLPTPPTSPPILMQPNHSTACPVIDSLNLYLTHHILTHLVLWTWFSLFTPKLRSIVLPLMWTLGTWTAFFFQLCAGSLFYLHRLLLSPVLKPPELCCSCFNLHSFYNPYAWWTGIHRYFYSMLLYDVWSRICKIKDL